MDEFNQYTKAKKLTAEKFKKFVKTIIYSECNKAYGSDYSDEVAFKKDSHYRFGKLIDKMRERKCQKNIADVKLEVAGL